MIDDLLATPTVRTALDFFGVDAEIEIVEPHFMLAGTNFSLLMTMPEYFKSRHRGDLQEPVRPQSPAAAR